MVRPSWRLPTVAHSPPEAYEGTRSGRGGSGFARKTLEPAGPPGLRFRDPPAVIPLPVIRDAAARSEDGRDGIPLDLGTMDEPTETNAEGEHEGHQRPDARLHAGELHGRGLEGLV